MKFGLAFAALALAAPVAAEMPHIEPGRFRCAPIGTNVLEQEIAPLKVQQEMRIAFRLIKQNAESKRPATAAIKLLGPGGVTRIGVGQSVNDRFQMYAAMDSPSMKQQLLYQFPLTKNWIILRLTHDARGFLTVRNNDVDQRFPVGRASFVRTALHCHSGEWEIDVWPRSYLRPQP